MVQYENVCIESPGKQRLTSENSTHLYSPSDSSSDISIIKPKKKTYKREICDMS